MHNKGGKQAARGQKLIHEENKETIKFYLLGGSTATILAFLTHYFYLSTTGAGWIGWSIATILVFISMFAMKTMIKNVRNERNQIIDAGADLNDPQAFGEYLKDAVILSSLVHLLSVLWINFYWILMVIPALALYKLWTVILAPWFFAQSYDNGGGEENDKKQKKREKRVFIRR